MVYEREAQANPRSTILFRILGVLGLVAVGLGIYYTPWFLDGRGTFHNTTDVADLNGDGQLDVILVNVRNESEMVAFHQITLWTNRGGGRFTPNVFETPPFLYLSAASADVDRDGDADMTLLRSDLLELFLNQGGAQGGETGEFKPHNPIRPSGDTGTPGSVVLGDLNNDGEVDGFVAGCCGMSWQDQSGKEVYLPPISWVWINEWDPRGWLVRHTLDLKELEGLPVREAALGDLDGDGNLDVFAAVLAPKPGRASRPADLVLLNDGSGNLRVSGQRLGETDSTSVALGDLDGDGDLDALVGTQDGWVVWTNLGGMQGGQAGEFAASGQERAGSPSSAVFLSDFDGDGDLDALVAGVRQAVIWWNDGHGAFTRSDQRFSYSQRHGLAIEDFNSDGHPDIFAAAYSQDYKIWFNRGDGTFR